MDTKLEYEILSKDTTGEKDMDVAVTPESLNTKDKQVFTGNKKAINTGNKILLMTTYIIVGTRFYN
jgi:hypothetical protein